MGRAVRLTLRFFRSLEFFNNWAILTNVSLFSVEKTSIQPAKDFNRKAQEIFRIVYPCAACKIQRRKCGDNCPLAPYFPPNDPHKFLLVNKLFGSSRILKIIQDIPGEKRADAVNSMVYEASARVVDPIYGCTGAICRVQKQILQLATTQAELLNAQANLSLQDFIMPVK
ncbi:LOB domain-containing protein 11-like [Cryptomeria japonica]|uniref:LOB domain-containing protein 11-like n=1 Tax=Cryptomeria japonica TaxID=3369 RepID=UPI0027DA9774|nr:LOB domain-containing protein 11-like [Cryptomeria japonica]